MADDDQQGYATGQRDHQRHTVTGRVVAHFGSSARHEVGVSVLTCTIRNDTRRNAVALHYRGGAGPWNLMREALRYSYGTSHSASQTYGGLDANSAVILGAFGYPYPVASRGDIYIANLSYDIPSKQGPFGGFKIYNDHSILRKRVGNYKSSLQNVSGMTFSAGKWVFYADFMLGKHHPDISPDGGGLASTSSVHDGFTRRVNVQAGYYF